MCDFPALQVIKVHKKFIVKHSHSTQMPPTDVYDTRLDLVGAQIDINP